MELLGVYVLLEQLKIPVSILEDDNLWCISLSNNHYLPETQKRTITFSFDKMSKVQKETFMSLNNVVFIEIQPGSHDVVSFDAPSNVTIDLKNWVIYLKCGDKI